MNFDLVLSKLDTRRYFRAGNHMKEQRLANTVVLIFKKTIYIFWNQHGQIRIRFEYICNFLTVKWRVSTLPSHRKGEKVAFGRTLQPGRKCGRRIPAFELSTLEPVQTRQLSTQSLYSKSKHIFSQGHTVSRRVTHHPQIFCDVCLYV